MSTMLTVLLDLPPSSTKMPATVEKELEGTRFRIKTKYASSDDPAMSTASSAIKLAHVLFRMNIPLRSIPEFVVAS